MCILFSRSSRRAKAAASFLEEKKINSILLHPQSTPALNSSITNHHYRPMANKPPVGAHLWGIGRAMSKCHRLRFSEVGHFDEMGGIATHTYTHILDIRATHIMVTTTSNNEEQ